MEWEETSGIKGREKVLIKTDMLELFMEANEGRDLRDKGKCEKQSQETVQLKKRFPEETAKRFYQTGVMICLHANRLYHVLRLTRQQKTYVWKEKRKDDDIYVRSTKSMRSVMSSWKRKNRKALRKANSMQIQKRKLKKRRERCGNQKADTQALPDWRCGISAGSAIE